MRSTTGAASPGTGISPDQFALFRISLKLPEGPDTKAVSFPATQMCSDGTVVRWDQPPPSDGAEPQYPAPVHTLSEAKTAAASTTDNSARWLAGGALTIAALAIAGTLLSRRRS